MKQHPRDCTSFRDAGAVRMSGENAERAGVATITRFLEAPVPETVRSDTPPGLVIVDPPYGHRLGRDRSPASLYGTLGRTLRERFASWRVVIVTSDPRLAQATGLALETPFPHDHNGGAWATLYLAGPLP